MKLFPKESFPDHFVLFANTWIVVQLLSFAPKLTLFLLLLVIFGQCRTQRISSLYLGQLGGITGEKALTVLLLKNLSLEVHILSALSEGTWSESPHGGCSGYKIELQKIWENQPNIKGILHHLFQVTVKHILNLQNAHCSFPCSQRVRKIITYTIRGSQKPPEEVPASFSLFLLLLLLLWDDNLSNCMFHHPDRNRSGRLLAFGTAEINSLFEKTLEFFVAAGRKQLVPLQRLQHEMLLLSSWMQLMLASAATSDSASKASCWRHSF